MYSIHFDNKVITFTNRFETVGPDDYVVVQGQQFDFTKVLQKVENNKDVRVVGSDSSELFDKFCSFCRVAEAAGGLVRNDQGRVLMIFRNGRWDLPKGHLERGEELGECALREVEEECGIVGMELGEAICSTMHIYPLKGEWILKKSYWYAMKYRGEAEPKPQTEEGIERVEWLDDEQVHEALKNSYKTIIEVFNHEKK